VRLFVGLLLSMLPVFAQSGYRLLATIPVGGEGGWDYLTADPASHRVFVSHGTEVDVIDTIKREVSGKITGLKGVHGIALAPELNRGFISNGQANSVTVFDMKTLARIGDDLPAGKKPDAILYDPASKRVFAFNGDSQNATVIDAALAAVTGGVDLGGAPEFAASNGEFAIFVNLEDKSATVRVDARKALIQQRWPLAPCEEPSSMAIDTARKRLYIGCHNKMMAALDTTSGKVVATPPICEGVDASAYDPGENLIFHSCSDGTITVLRPDSADAFTVVETIQTHAGSRTMALDPATHELFVPAADFEPQPAPAEGQERRRKIVSGSFRVLVFGKQ
jgi:DNA-binding beta-propeller fold protein YncE